MSVRYGLSQLPIAYVHVRFCAHATEDVDKVMEAIDNIFPSNEIENISFDKSDVEGHYGNPIIFFEKRIKKKATINSMVKKFSTNLSVLDKEEIGRNVNRYVENGSLYIRLNKQALLQGKIKLVKSDPIHIRIRFEKSKIEDIISICKEIGMLP
jgi:RNA binding exosome subunit